VHRIVGDEIPREDVRDCGARMIGSAWTTMLVRWAILYVEGGKSEQERRRRWK
jgi:hypothetical protein